MKRMHDVKLCVLGLASMIAGACTSTPAKPAADKQESASTAASSNEPAVAAKQADPGGGGDKKVDGYDVIHAKTKGGGSAEIAVEAPPGWQVVQPPTSPDPHGGKFTLAEAVKGVKGKGQLVAHISTTLGDFDCDLYDDKAPITVANFVGLARGLRKFWDPKAQAWTARRYYDGTTFHRVIPGFMIQGGDSAGDGSGRVWYSIADELHPSLHHDRGGQLCMANRGPNTNEAQFFITESAAPHLDGSYSIFGQCEPSELVYRIARVPQSGPPNNRPLTPVVINSVDVTRVEGGARAAQPLEERDPSAPVGRNTVPGVAPPGRAVQADPAP